MSSFSILRPVMPSAMESARIQELESLLRRALPSVVIRRGSDVEMSRDAYREILLRNRAAHDVGLKHLASLCRPEILQASLKDRILGIVNGELADYARDGKIHSATIAFAGGLVSGSGVDDVALNLVRRACVDGPDVAARAFADCITGMSCRFCEFFLISGIRIPEPSEVFDGIALVPLPEEAVDLPPHLPNVDDGPSITTTHLLQDTRCMAIPFVDVHPKTIAATLAVRSIPEAETQAVVVILVDQHTCNDGWGMPDCPAIVSISPVWPGKGLVPINQSLQRFRTTSITTTVGKDRPRFRPTPIGDDTQMRIAWPPSDAERQASFTKSVVVILAAIVTLRARTCWARLWSASNTKSHRFSTDPQSLTRWSPARINTSKSK